VTGLLDAPAVGILDTPLRDVHSVSQASTFAAGALGIYESARRTYNSEIDRLNREWSDFTAANSTGDDATDAEQAAADDALGSKRASLRGQQHAAEGSLDGSAHQVAGLLDKGPGAMSDPTVASLITAGLRHVPPAGGSGTDSLRVLTFNVGGGAENSPFNSKGLDRQDISALATRILQGDPDVANLQEMFDGERDDLEKELERQSGDDWTLTFSRAANKTYWSGNPLDAVDGFGNVIAVRAPDDGSAGDSGISLVDTEDRELTDPSNWLGQGGGDGGDGRSMGAVTIETVDGQRVTIGTTQTDWEKSVSSEDQADQIRDFREYTEQFAEDSGADHVVLTGDLNHEIDDDNASGEEIRSWEEDYANAGAEADAGHRGNGNEIDYIWSSDGLGYDKDSVQLIEGDHPYIDGDDDFMSDHNGIALDLDLPTIATPEFDPPERPDNEAPHWDELPDDSGSDTEPSPSPGPSPTPSGD
ncbi:MAG: endonuclease/exonuclease/phosphatase family protein, partial [Nocardioidaceae bacterium]